VQQSIYHLIACALPVAIVLGVRHHRVARPLPWLLIAAGTALTAAGDFVYDGYGWFNAAAVPFPSGADGLYLVGYVVSIVGVCVLTARATRGLSRWLIDTLILGLAGSTLLFVTLIAPEFDQAGSGLARLVACAYPVMDVLLLLAIVPLAFARVRNQALGCLVAFGIITLYGDVIYGVEVLRGIYTVGGWVDTIWPLANVALMIGVLSPALATADEPIKESRDDWVRLALLAISLVVVLCIMGASKPGWDDSFVVVVLLAATTTVLVLVRAALIYAELRSASGSLERERLRVEAMERVQNAVASTDLDLDRALGIVCSETVALVGGTAATVLIQADGLSVRASAGDGRPDRGSAVGPESLAALAIAQDELVICRDTESEPNDRELSRALGLRSLMASPIHFGGAPNGALVVMSPQVDAFDTRDERTLQLMSSLASVAASRSSEFAARTALAQIVDSSDDAIVAQTLDGDVVSWNAGAERMYGFSAHEMIGRRVDPIVPEDVHNEVVDYRERVAQGASIAPFETERLTKDARRFAVSLGISPVRDGRGRVVGLSTIARDISARKELEHQLYQAQKMEAVGRLAGGIAHDFNNLLLAIQGYGSMLLERVTGDATSAKYARQVLEAAERSAELTQQLLAYSRKQVLSPTVVDVNDVADEIRRLVERMIGEDIEIDARLDPDAGHVLVDRARLGQVIMNLCVNARDAMPNGGRLTIETASVDSASVRLTVTDTGCGMDEATRDKIFEPFFTTKAVGEGTGLGLATADGTVTQSGGHITVDTAVGRGTSISVFLPQCAFVPDRAADAVDPYAGRGLGERILVVEDQTQVRAVLAELLERAGYAVTAVSDAEEALAAGGDFDLLLTDIVMPGISGVELAERMRADHPELRIVFTSGYAGDRLEGALEQIDATFLQKPYQGDELRTAIRLSLDGRTTGSQEHVTVR
jgi:PAS domain S-box-containing protein